MSLLCWVHRHLGSEIQMRVVISIPRWGGVIFCSRQCSNLRGPLAFWGWFPWSTWLENVSRFLFWWKILSDGRDPAPGSWKSGSKQHPWPTDFDWFFGGFCLWKKAWGWRIAPDLIQVARNTLYSKGMQYGSHRTTQIRASPRNSLKSDITHPPLDRVLRSPPSYYEMLEAIISWPVAGGSFAQFCCSTKSAADEMKMIR